MSDKDNNQFKQVATLLISITIIVGGIIYNGAVTKTEAQFGVLVDEIPLLSNLVDNLQSDIEPSTNATQDTETNNTTNKTPQKPTPTTNKVPLTETTTITPIKAAEKIDKILAPIEQFLSLMENIDFAHAGPSLSLPKLPEKINSTPVPGLEKPKENIVNDVAMPTIDKSTENTVIEQIKRFTGYSRWEEFKENFKNNMGSGECMVKISDFCLVRW